MESRLVLSFPIKQNLARCLGITYSVWASIFWWIGISNDMLWVMPPVEHFWTTDPKLNNTAIGLLIYSAYFVLRGSLEDEIQRGRLSAVYNIFAYTVFIPLIYILPRMTDSLHPGSGNNPTFRLFDTSHDMKLVVYTAIIGFILLGWWFLTIFLRVRTLKKFHDENA